MLLRCVVLALFSGCAQPTGGTWEFTGTSTEQNCPASYLPSRDPEGEATIEVDPEVPEIILTQSDVWEPAHCPLSGMEFACDHAETDETVELTEQGYDATIVSDASTSGTFDSETTAHGLTSLNTTCTGLQCTEASDDGYPACNVAWYWSAELVQ